jgi:hypothetical protein
MSSQKDADDRVESRPDGRSEVSLMGPFRDTRRLQDAEEPARPRVRIGGFGQHRYADPARSLCAVDRRCRHAGP